MGESTAPVWFIGDWVTAMGYRLAGVEVVSPPVEETRDVLERAVKEGARVVLLSAEHAAELERGELAELLARKKPLLLIVPDARGRAAPYDVGAKARAVLGSEI